MTQNSELQKENALLKAQFDEACQVASQFQDLHAKYQEVVAKLRETEESKEDLNHRLEICVQNNRELTRQVAELTKHKSTQAGTDAETCNSRIEQINRQSSRKIEALTEEIERLSQEKASAELKRKEDSNMIQRTLNSAHRYFQKPVASLHDLISLFDTTEFHATDEHPLSDNTKEIKLKKRLDKMKLKMADGKRTIMEMDKAIREAQTDSEQSQRCLQKKIAELETTVADLTRELTIKKVQHKDDVAKFEEQVRKLRDENSKLQKEATQVPQVVEKVVVAESDNGKQIKKFERRHNEITAELSAVSEQLKIERQKKDQIASDLRESEKLRDQLKMEADKMAGEVEALNAVIKEMQTENASMRKALETATKLPEEPKQPVKPRIDVQSRVKKMERELERSQEEIVTLKSKIAAQQRKIECQEAQIRQEKYHQEKCQEEICELRSALAESRVYDEERKKIKPEPTLTENGFVCEDLEPELSVAVRRIASNPTLEPDSKVHACFKAIAQFYTEKLDTLESDMDKLCVVNRDLSDAVNQFLIDLSIALTDKPVTLEQFLTQKAGKMIVKAVKELRMNYENAKRERDGLNTIVAHFFDAFSDAKSDPIAVIDELKNALQFHSSKLAKKAKELKIAKMDALKLAEALTEVKNDYAAKKVELNAKIDEITAQLNAAEREAIALKVEKDNLIRELSDVRSYQENLEQEIIARESERMKKVTERANEQISNLTVELEKAKEQFASQAKKVHAMEKALSKLSAINGSLEAQNSSLSDEIEELKSVLSLTEKRLSAQSETEKGEIRNSYEKAIAQLREQCEKHRADMQKVVQSRKDVEDVLNATEEEYANVTRINDKLKREVKRMSDMIDRERKLAETSSVAKQIALEREFESRLNEVRAKAETDKKRAWTYFAESLSQFFSPHETINERTVKRVVDKAKEELDRLNTLETTIRQMVRARDGQSTQDAVARLIL